VWLNHLVICHIDCSRFSGVSGVLAFVILTVRLWRGLWQLLCNVNVLGQNVTVERGQPKLGACQLAVQTLNHLIIK
jgi:hypothetical protein